MFLSTARLRPPPTGVPALGFLLPYLILDVCARNPPIGFLDEPADTPRAAAEALDDTVTALCSATRRTVQGARRSLVSHGRISWDPESDSWTLSREALESLEAGRREIAVMVRAVDDFLFVHDELEPLALRPPAALPLDSPNTRRRYTHEDDHRSPLVRPRPSCRCRGS